jgi:hypothetical protein
MNARADVADLVGDLDQPGTGRLFRCFDHLPTPSFGFRQAHVVGALDDERRDTVGEFLRELLARGVGVLDRIMQPAGRNEFGVGAIGRGRKQVRDLGEVVDVRLMTAALARHPVVAARGELGGFGDEADG